MGSQGSWLYLDLLLYIAMFAIGFTPFVILVLKQRESNRHDKGAERALLMMISADEHARRDLARDLHDDIAQELAAARMLCERAVGAEDLEIAHERAEAAMLLLNECGKKVRGLSRKLRPPELESGGIVKAIDALCAVTRTIDGEDIGVFFDEGFPQLTANVEIHSYRIIQEAINNAIKHGAGQRISIRGYRDTPDGDQIRIEVINEGTPITAKAAPRFFELGGLGLVGMKERAALIGAQFYFDTTPTRTVVRLDLPKEKA